MFLGGRDGVKIWGESERLGLPEKRYLYNGHCFCWNSGTSGLTIFNRCSIYLLAELSSYNNFFFLRAGGLVPHRPIPANQQLRNSVTSWRECVGLARDLLNHIFDIRLSTART